MCLHWFLHSLNLLYFTVHNDLYVYTTNPNNVISVTPSTTTNTFTTAVKIYTINGSMSVTEPSGSGITPIDYSGGGMTAENINVSGNSSSSSLHTTVVENTSTKISHTGTTSITTSGVYITSTTSPSDTTTPMTGRSITLQKVILLFC